MPEVDQNQPLDERTKTILDCLRETFKPPYDVYKKYAKGSFGFTTLRTMKEKGYKIELKESESLDNECLHFSLNHDTPQEIITELSLNKSMYNGVRVFFDKLSGPIRPLKDSI